MTDNGQDFTERRCGSREKTASGDHECDQRCQALGIDGTFDGIDLLDRSSAIRLLDDGTPPPARPTVGPRVGISAAQDRPWRFSLSLIPI